MSAAAHPWQPHQLRPLHFPRSPFRTARYATKAPRPNARPQKLEPASKPAKPASNEAPSVPRPRPATLAHEPSRRAPKPVDGPEQVKRWEVRQKIGYKGVTWKITQLIVGIPVVIVFGYHLYGRMYLGWEQKQPIKIKEDGKEAYESIRFVGRDKPGA